MTGKLAYSGLTVLRCMHVIFKKLFTLFICFFTSIWVSPVFAQDEYDYDEISVFLDVPSIGGGEIDAVIRGEELYLPVTDLFDFLMIRNVPSQGLESVSGFFINPEATYLISRSENIIRYQDKTVTLEPGDLIRTESNLFLRSSYFGDVFGLECVFNFRSLSVIVNSKLELPLIREMRQKEMRRNLTRLKGEVKADTTIGRTYSLFKFGMADWSAIATEEIKGKSETRLNLSLGSMIAGGEASASLNYSSYDPFTEKQQYYLWRYVNNNFSPLRQVMAGKIATHATSTIYNPVVGVQLTNTPTTFRRSFGTYTLSDKTEPGWIVELYVNNVLIDYVKSDASGFFTFEVPLVYGNSVVQLKYFGPWGEERTREQNIIIPFNFLPKNTLEYIVSAGIVEDPLNSKFSRTSFNYGVARRLTVGGGVEYLSSLSSNPLMPFMNASLSITNNLLISGEYTHGVRTKGTFTYRLPSNMQFDLNYIKYARNQKAINYNYLEERKAVISLPLKIHKFSSYQRLTLHQILLPSSKYTTGEWMFSGALFGVNSNLTTYAMFIGEADPYFYSNLSVALKLPLGFVFMPQAQYVYNNNTLMSMKLGIEKHLLKHAFLNMSYENNFKNNLQTGELGLRYDFSFAQTGASVRQSNNRTTMVQYARGSLINDRETRYLGTDNRTNVGRGGITIIPYLDINSNGKRDHGEPKAHGLNLHSGNGRIERSEKDTVIRILGLEPYTDCFIEFDPNSFENISWRMKNRTIKVAVDPNMLKLIEIPISIAGEASGTVTIFRNGETSGLSRMIINFYDKNQKQAGRTITEDNGYFSYMGLASGNYMVRIDSGQLRKLGMTSSPDSIIFNITAGIEGDFIDGLDFTVRMKDTITTKVKIDTIKAPVVRRDTSLMIIHEVTEEILTTGQDTYALQIGAFRNKEYAEGYRRKIEALTGKKSEIKFEDGFYKVRIMDLKDRQEVDDNLAILKNNGVTQAWIIKLTAKKQQLIIIEKRDTITSITETGIPVPSKILFPELTGNYRLKTEARDALKRLNNRFGNRLIIVFEEGFYKLRPAPTPPVEQPALEVMKKHEPVVGKLEFKDLWRKVPVITYTVEEKPVPVKSDVSIEKVEIKKDVREIVQPVSKSRLIGKEPTVKTAPSEPTISLQVGVFRKKIDALKAQKRIIKKLSLPVEIVQEYEYYKVIVTGFYTREQTYRYYPELTQIGYPNIYLIEKKK